MSAFEIKWLDESYVFLKYLFIYLSALGLSTAHWIFNLLCGTWVP